MKSACDDDVHDFSGHWAMNLPEGKNNSAKPPLPKPTKPRAYKSIHASEYNEAVARRVSRTSSEVAAKIKSETENILDLLAGNGRG